MLAVMNANLQPDAAYPRAVDGIVRVRDRITKQLANSNDPKPLQLQLRFLDLEGNQPHIPLSELAKVQVPTALHKTAPLRCLNRIDSGLNT